MLDAQPPDSCPGCFPSEAVVAGKVETSRVIDQIAKLETWHSNPLLFNDCTLPLLFIVDVGFLVAISISYNYQSFGTQLTSHWCGLGHRRLVQWAAVQD